MNFKSIEQDVTQMIVITLQQGQMKVQYVFSSKEINFLFISWMEISMEVLHCNGHLQVS